ncbi:hypothetical protein Nepgr_018848 [Nepenthes gracilis]|uniref:Uncharacterized protein n=1 Tax=Nepenthes gracilis TaxID=150966 RepID=A0AAD3XTI3_NEPGR|nr:hypothetical protein Nepgr_018848 [Nepenthes gracilis]
MNIFDILYLALELNVVGVKRPKLTPGFRLWIAMLVIVSSIEMCQLWLGADSTKVEIADKLSHV